MTKRTRTGGSGTSARQRTSAGGAKPRGRREALGLLSAGALGLAGGLLDPRTAQAQGVMQRKSGGTQMKSTTASQPFQFMAKNLTLTPSQPQSGQSVTIKLTVETFGSGTKSVPWKISRGTTVLAQGTRSNVAAGTTFDQTATWQATAGTHSIKGEVDPSNSLNEPSYLRGNNSKTVSVTVPQPPNWPAWGTAAYNGAKQGINLWQQQAKLTGVRINGPVAIGGRIVGPSIKNSIKSAMQGAGAPADTADKFADAVADAWKLWHEGVKVPGLPWYPAFAAFPGPQAPPMPNVPTPLAALPSNRAGELLPNNLKNRIRNKLGSTIMAQQGAGAAVDSFVNAFTGRFAAWTASLQVIAVQGKGPVPSFAPPYVPVGPVVNGSTLEIPGSFITTGF